MSHVCFLGHISVELAQEIPKALSEERESLEEAGIYTWVRSLAFESREYHVDQNLTQTMNAHALLSAHPILVR